MNSPPASSGDGPDLRPRTAALLLALLIAAHIAANVWWIRVDNHAIVADEALHMDVARKYHAALFDVETPSPRAILRALHAIEFPYPPLLHVLGAFAIAAFGDATDAIAFTGAPLLAALILGVYLFCRTFLARAPALFATAVASLCPIVYAASRYYMTDYPAAVIVVWGCYALAKSNRYRNTGWVFAFSILNGLGFLAKQSTCLFFLLPCALLITLGFVTCLRRDGRFQVDRAGLRALALNMLLTGVVTIGIAAPWYFHTLMAQEAHWTEYMARERPWLPEGWEHWTGWPLYMVNECIFLPTALLALAGAVYTLRRRRRQDAAWLLLVWGVASYPLGTELLRVVLPRYMIPAVPAVGVLAALALWAIPWRRLRLAAVGAFAALLLVQFANLTFASLGPAGAIEIPLGLDNYYVRTMPNKGLAIIQDRLVAGAYSFYPAFRGPNWVDRVFEEMRAAELSRVQATQVEAGYVVCGIGKLALELRQAEFRPRSNPLDPASPSRHRRPSPFVHIGTAAKAPDIEVGLIEDPAASGAPVTYTPESGRVAASVHANEQLHVRIHPPNLLDALTLGFVTPDRSAVRYRAVYRDADAQDWREFDPPVRYGGDAGAGRPDRRHFHRFEGANVAEVRILFEEPARPGGDIALDSLGLLRHAPQPRTLACWGLAGDGDALPKTIGRADYAIVAEKALTPIALEALAEFEKIARFDRPEYGLHPALTLTVWARRQEPIITYESAPRFRVHVSDSDPTEGAWDAAWWMPSERTPMNPKPPAFWRAASPALIEIELGERCAVSGIEVIPYTADAGVGAVRASYWDAETHAWRRIGDPDPARTPVVARPRYDDRFAERRVPAPWPKPVVTDLLRIELDARNPAVNPHVYVSDVLIYGRPVLPDD